MGGLGKESMGYEGFDNLNCFRGNVDKEENKRREGEREKDKYLTETQV